MRGYCTLGSGAAASLFERRLVKLDLIPSDLICFQLMVHVRVCFHTDAYQINPASATSLSWHAVYRNPIVAIDGADAGETADTAVGLITRFINALKGLEISDGVLETRLKLQSQATLNSRRYHFAFSSRRHLPVDRRRKPVGLWDKLF